MLQPEADKPNLFAIRYITCIMLGLSICKQIVQGHGGRVEVKSKLGVGTSFAVMLPRSGKTVPRP